MGYLHNKIELANGIFTQSRDEGIATLTALYKMQGTIARNRQANILAGDVFTRAEGPKCECGECECRHKASSHKARKH